MRARGYRKKAINVSDQFSKQEQYVIVKTIEENYKRPTNQISDKQRFDWELLGALIGFSLKKSRIVIREFPDIINVSIIKCAAKI